MGQPDSERDFASAGHSRPTSTSGSSQSGSPMPDGSLAEGVVSKPAQRPSRQPGARAGAEGDTTSVELAPFPQLSNNAPESPRADTKQTISDGEDEEPATAKGFQRSISPKSALLRNKEAIYHKVGEEGICKMHKFSLYETASRYYLVGGDVTDRKFRILKIARTADAEELGITEDDIVYTKKEMNQILNAVDDGNRASGGLKLKCTTWGLLGFIRFTSAYYMLLITKRSQVAMIGGHYIYQIDDTELVSLTLPSSRFKLDRDAEEARFVGTLNNLDLTRYFYFSYSYDITRTLQHNIVRERRILHKGLANIPERTHNSMFVWNHHLLYPASVALRHTYDWCLPIIHGFIDQASASSSTLGFRIADNPIALSIYGRTVYITVIARRSRFFAGARFLKRGANDLVVPSFIGEVLLTHKLIKL